MSDATSNWATLLSVFFGPANRLTWPSTHAALAPLMRLNEQLLQRDPPGPVILPLADQSGSTTYYAVAGDDDQARHLGDVLGSFIGPTGTTFTGRPLQPDPYDQVEAALVRFAGSPARVFRFDVPTSERERVRAQVRRLLTTWTARPKRTLGDVVPVGRLLDDFEDALEQGHEDRARHLLYQELLRQGRLSGPNRLFLEARFLATFQHWDTFEALPDLGDLLRLRRPALVSDALAQLALQRLTGVDPADWPAAFTDEVAGPFGSLIPSLDAVRSPVGAAYHVLWSLHAGEPGATVAARLAGTPWVAHPLVAPLLPSGSQLRPGPGGGAVGHDTARAVEEAITAGLYERAIELLEAGPADLGFVAVAGRILRETLNLRATELLRRYRLELGEQAVQDELGKVAALTVSPSEADDDAAPRVELPETMTWPEAFRRLANCEWTGRATDLEEKGLVELLRGDELPGVVAAIDAVDGTDLGPMLDQGFALCRRLDAAGANPDLLVPLRRKLVETWAIGDGSGQRRRAEMMLQQLERLLRDGVGPDDYSDLVEQVTLGWTPFLTDQSVGLSLTTLELLAGFRPTDDDSLSALASAVLNRIGPYNAARIDRADLLTARRMAGEFGFSPDFGDALAAPATGHATRQVPAGFVIGLYSLEESALHRAADVLREEYSGAAVETNSDKVATEALRASVRRADVFVMAEGSSKHAATDAIKVARYPRPFGRAAGKGSSSLIRAAEEQISEWFDDLAA